jgi:hypothetical protein
VLRSPRMHSRPRAERVAARTERAKLAFALACWLACGCARGPEPCLNAGACPDGEECLANRCVPAGGTTVPADSLRVVCELRNASPEGPITLDFEPRWRVLTRIDAAFLLVEAEGPPEPPLRVEVRSVGSTWTHGGRLPPRGEGLMARPGRARIDVTDLVRSWQSTSDAARGIALSAEDGSEPPLSWGTSGGTPPRLEVYGR